MKFHRGKIADVTVGPRWRVKQAADKDPPPTPGVGDLFGTVERVAWGMDREPAQLREVGETLAFLKQPEPPGGWREAFDMLPLLRTVLAMKPRSVGSAPCQEMVEEGE